MDRDSSQDIVSRLLTSMVRYTDLALRMRLRMEIAQWSSLPFETFPTSEKEESDDGEIPRCQHGKPCVKLTARTGENSGREFYKCSLPRDSGEQCDFFKWLDGDQVGDFSCTVASSVRSEDTSMDKPDIHLLW